MPTVSEQLRHAREAMKLDFRQVAEATKLKSDQIRALEQGDFDAFTAPVYLRGSLRTYAHLLKLDSAKLIAQLDEELSSTKQFGADGPAPLRKKSGLDSIMLVLSRLNWGVAGAIIVLVLIVLGGNAAFRTWRNRKPSDPLQSLSAGMYQPSEPAGEILPVPTNNLRHTP